MIALKDYLGILSVIIALAAYSRYFWTIHKGQTKPHIFSWVIWGILEFIAFAAQLSDHAGAGAWVTGVTAAFCFVVAALSIKNGEKHITRFDYACFLSALLAIPLWYFTKNPLGSVLLVSGIDALGFVPTYRKAFKKPHEETLITYLLSGLKCAISLLALDHISLLTALYPASLVVTNLGFVIIMLVCRQRRPIFST